MGYLVNRLRLDWLACNMAVVKATYGYRGRFINNHNVLIHMHNCDWLASDGYFVSAKIYLWVSAHLVRLYVTFGAFEWADIRVTSDPDTPYK